VKQYGKARERPERARGQRRFGPHRPGPAL